MTVSASYESRSTVTESEETDEVPLNVKRAPYRIVKEDSPRVMGELADLLEGLDDFSLENQEREVMAWVEANGYKLGDVMNAFRLALVGIGKGPGMFDISAFLGKEETLRRLRRAVETIKN